MPPQRRRQIDPPPVLDQILPMARNSHFVSLLSNFEGESSEECNFFFQQFEEISRLSGWNEQEKIMIFRAKLKGRALRFLISDPSLIGLREFQQLKNAFLEYFNDEQDLTNKQLKFNNIVQRESEPVKDLAQRIIIASNSYLGVVEANINRETKEMLNKLRLSKFISALNSELQTEVLKANPETFEEAIKYATNIQGALNTAMSLKINNLLHETHSNDTMQEIQQLKQQINNLSINRETKKCQLCGDTRHYSIHCEVYKNVYLQAPIPQNNYRGQFRERQAHYTTHDRQQNQFQRQQNNHRFNNPPRRVNNWSEQHSGNSRNQPRFQQHQRSQTYNNRRGQRQFHNNQPSRNSYNNPGYDSREQYHEGHTHNTVEQNNVNTHENEENNEQDFLEVGPQNTSPT